MILTTAVAGFLLCDPRTLSAGMSINEVRSACGEPFRIGLVAKGLPPTETQQWLYDGWNILIFENKKLVDMILHNKDGKLR